MTERRDIASRLENWARWCATWGEFPRGGDSCITAVICENMLRNSKNYVAPAVPERRQIDEEDAKRIELGLRELTEVHREVLRLHYVYQRAWTNICHIVGIRARRKDFADVLQIATNEIEFLTEIS